MTYGILKKIFEENHIPENAVLMSDSGWELCATNMDGIFYNKKENCVVFTQSTIFDDKEEYMMEPWKQLYSC